jgi:hypothetical protein
MPPIILPRNVAELVSNTPEQLDGELIELLTSSGWTGASGEPAPPGLVRIARFLLSAGEDAVITRALDEVARALGSDVANAVVALVEQEAIRLEVEGVDGSAQHAVLYAIPVQVFTRDPSTHVGGALGADRQRTLDRFAASFLKHEFIAKESRVDVLPYLYEAEELRELGFSDWRKFTKNFFTHVFDRAVRWEPADLMQTADSARKADPSGFQRAFKVLYLVMGFVLPRNEAPFRFSKTEGIEPDEFVSRVAGWRADCVPLLRELCGDEKVLIQADVPAEACEAFRKGMENYRSSRFHIELLEQLQQTDLLPPEMRVIVTAHGDDGYLSEYRVSALEMESGDLVFGLVHPYYGWEEPPVVEAALEFQLREENFASVEMPDELLPDSRCECCGEPLFAQRGDAEGELPEWTGHTLH